MTKEVLAVLVACGVAGAALADEATPTEPIEAQVEELPALDAADTVTVVDLDAEAGTLRVHTANGPRLYRVSETTRVVRDGRDVALDSLHAPERVVVSAVETDDGLTATLVTVVALGPAPADRPEPSASGP